MSQGQFGSYNGLSGVVAVGGHLAGSDPAGLGVTMEAVRLPSRAWGTARRVSPALDAIGQTADALTTARATGVSAGLAIVGITIGLLIRGGAGFVVGKALAPSREAETTWSWAGAGLGLFFGTLGMGGQALYSLSKRS